jgi:hypothetical protein
MVVDAARYPPARWETLTSKMGTRLQPIELWRTLFGPGTVLGALAKFDHAIGTRRERLLESQETRLHRPLGRTWYAPFGRCRAAVQS